ncbi:hypothetical protein GCM10010232_45440 [Streptomyces amakusaensis]|uniref:Uncharacterized protein n=1 Tax=Streptomyces amakusaensis TaxID=67271 RepID=A0ABW0ALP7_9ACTN
MAAEGFDPTHVVPGSGLPAWEAPDVSRPTEPLDPLLPVRLIDRYGDWSRILCANGWSAWVDGRLLITVGREPPAPGLPPARTADPRPLLTRVEETIARYRRAADELAAGRIDAESFRERTRGLRAGAVVEGDSVWLYDAEHERWVYADGAGATAFAVSSEPSGPAPAPAEAPGDATRDASQVRPEPTRVVDPARETGRETERKTADGGPSGPGEP